MKLDNMIKIGVKLNFDYSAVLKAGDDILEIKYNPDEFYKFMISRFISDRGYWITEHLCINYEGLFHTLDEFYKGAVLA